MWHMPSFFTRRSTTGIIFLLYSTQIICDAKQQNTIKYSKFDSEFVAVIATEPSQTL